MASINPNFGKAISLNGEDHFVEITAGNENELEFPGGSMSIEGWFKVDAFDTDWQALISKGEGTAYRVARRASTDSIAYAGGRGEWMKMPGQTFTEIVKNNANVAVLVGTDEVQVDAGTGSSLTTVRVNLAAGNHPIEIGYYEMTGGSFLRGVGAQFGTTGRLPTLTLGPPGAYSLLPSLKLTTRPPGVDPAPENPTIALTREDGTLRLTYTGTLQSSETADGTYTDVAGASSPYTVDASTGSRFFRSRN